ncbi:DUF86 domain-containing protein [Paramicrobacterium agarici]|uniref:DUF86 domain-containing protein n=1 Tax=Paramicrobacterium agarici TaxID=630514 RepID=UPI00114E4429|nr:HepT-like ribonuclease domain-containing protein [Microbacterium agarici]
MVDRLGDKKVLPRDVAHGMRGAVGFRNVLVHEYVEADDEVVMTQLRNHNDLYDFVARIAEYLDGPT